MAPANILPAGGGEFSTAIGLIPHHQLTHFEEGAEMAMKQLVDILPGSLDLWEKNTEN